MWLTPTYHLFSLYAPHRGAQAIRTEMEEAPTRDVKPVASVHGPMPAGSMALLSASASQKDGQLILSLSNRQKDTPQEVTITIRDARVGSGTLRAMTGEASAFNTAEQPEAVRVTETPIDARGDTLKLTLPPCSVQTLLLSLA